MLLGVDAETLFVTLASENASSWLAKHISELGSDSLVASVTSGNPVDPLRVEVFGAQYDAIVHRTDGVVLVELEPALSSLAYARTSVVGAIQRLSQISDPVQLRAAAAHEIRAITGFDRVMVYKFYEDDHGEVAAESRVSEMEPYLGLHFPASDIPLQARNLYLTKLSRAIVSTTDPGSQLIALDESAASTDLSLAELRAVSPHHLQFMRNMGQASTVSFSLIIDGRLEGMITCAHREERRLPVLLRRALEVLATVVSMQLGSIDKLEKMGHSLRIVEQRAALLAPLFANEELSTALLDGEKTVLDLIDADGVIIRVGDSIRSAGMVPASEFIEPLLTAINCESIATSCLTADRPDLAELAPGFAGLLSVPFADTKDCLLFFRREVAHVVNWLGDQGPENRLDPLSPRLSFSAWQQSVTGTSIDWGHVAQEAIDLVSELHGALLRRSEARLAALAMRDSLTGLRNRRYLLERLTETESAFDGRALLFLDLDNFKIVNDTHGHEVGDAVLIEVSRRLETCARVDDIVARLGGDEFVILCDGVEPADATGIAQRVVDSLAEPFEVVGHTISITASCGVAMDTSGGTGTVGAAWIDEADNAMYRAKRTGRNRVSS